MDSGIRSKLERWLRQQILVQEDERGRCKRIALCHVVSGKLGQEIASFKVPSKSLEDDYFGETISAIDTSIVDDAEPLGGVQTYVVFPYFEGSSKPGSRFTIREVSTSVEDPESIESEPATKTGLLSQLMRHNEANARTSALALGTILNTLRTTNQRQADTIEKLLTDRQANFETMEKLRSEETERSLLMKREEASEKFKTDMMEKFTLLLPVVVNKIAGKNLLPGKTGTETVIQGLFESIDQEQLTKLQTIMRPEQIAAMLEIFQSLQAAEEERKKANGSGVKAN